jgi:hypothetical protein
MSLSDLASLGSFVSGIAVLASLGFLYFQMRQMTEQVKQSEKNQQAAIRLGRSSRIVDIMLATMDPSITEAMMKASLGDKSLTLVQLTQYQAFMVAIVNHFEDSFYQHEEGLLNDTAFATVLGGIRASVSSPGYRAGWKMLFPLREGAFPEFMNRIIAETPLEPPGDLLEQWHKAINEARAAANV